MGAALLVGLIVLLFWWKKRRDNEDEEQFFDMTNPNEKKFDGITPNPFLTAAGAGGAGAAGAGGRMALGTAAHAHQGSNTTHSYSSNNEDVLHYDDNHHGDLAGQDEFFSTGAGEDYGRRRLLNGSLPDMIMRKPGSLQVVNN